MARHTTSTEERLGELEKRLDSLTTLLMAQFSAEELHELAELMADDLLRDGVDVRSSGDLLDSEIAGVS